MHLLWCLKCKNHLFRRNISQGFSVTNWESRGICTPSYNKLNHGWNVKTSPQKEKEARQNCLLLKNRKRAWLNAHNLKFFFRSFYGIATFVSLSRVNHWLFISRWLISRNLTMWYVNYWYGISLNNDFVLVKTCENVELTNNVTVKWLCDNVIACLKGQIFFIPLFQRAVFWMPWISWSAGQNL